MKTKNSLFRSTLLARMSIGILCSKPATSSRLGASARPRGKLLLNAVYFQHFHFHLAEIKKAPLQKECFKFSAFLRRS